MSEVMAPQKIKARGLPHRRCCTLDEDCLFWQAGCYLSGHALYYPLQ